MTGPRVTHPEYEELISASLTGDLSAQERQRLDVHLDTCDACRGTLAAFSDGRRILAGVRHVPIPRDLHARVRSGIEAGAFADVPWWRRPAVMFAGIGGGLAAVAGAMLALVILTQDPGPVGQATPSPTPTLAPVQSPTASPAPIATAAPTTTPAAAASLPPASASPNASPSAPVATAAPTPVPTAPEPDVYLGHTGPSDNRALIISDGATGETLTEVGETPPGPPIAAELSPDGGWLAYITRVGESGLHEVRATRIAGDSVGETVVLGESLSDDAFLEQLFWSSPGGALLAYTLADPVTGDTDVWVFEAETGEFWQLTGTGNTYAGSWIPGEDDADPRLWISVAGETPVSHLNQLRDDSGRYLEGIDAAGRALATAEGVFQPLLNVSGRFAIYWDGSMERSGDEGDGPWRFVAGTQPYLAAHTWESEVVQFDSERPVFADITVGRDGFTSASITWGPDGDTYAIWGARWTGTSQSGTGEAPYPDEGRVYFSRATDARGMTRGQAIDVDDIPDGWAVVDVKLSPTGEHLVITAARPLAGTLDPPEADLLLVDRNYADEPDVVTPLRGEDDEHWWGPAAFDER